MAKKKKSVNTSLHTFSQFTNWYGEKAALPSGIICCFHSGAVYFILRAQHSSWIFMIVPLNVRTQRRLFLPGWERGGWEKRQHARVRLRLSHRIWGQISSQLILLCTAQGKQQWTDERQTHREKERQGGRERKRERNAAVFLKHAHFLDISSSGSYLQSGTDRVTTTLLKKQMSQQSSGSRRTLRYKRLLQCISWKMDETYWG